MFYRDLLCHFLLLLSNIMLYCLLFQIHKLELQLEEAATDFEHKEANLTKQLELAQANNDQLELALKEKEQWIAILEDKELKWTQLEEAAKLNDRFSPLGRETSLADSLLRTEVYIYRSMSPCPSRCKLFSIF